MAAPALSTVPANPAIEPEFEQVSSKTLHTTPHHTTFPPQHMGEASWLKASPVFPRCNL